MLACFRQTGRFAAAVRDAQARALRAQPAHKRQPRLTETEHQHIFVSPLVQCISLESGKWNGATRLSREWDKPTSHYLNFNVAKPTSTSSMVMIQNLTTTCVSFQPFNS